MLTVVARLKAIEGKEADLQAALADMINQVKANEQGKTLTYSLHVADDDPTSFLFYEQYASAEALAEHGQTDHMKALGGKLAGVLDGRPVIERYTRVASLD